MTPIFNNNFKTVKDNSNLKQNKLGESFLYISGEFRPERFRDSWDPFAQLGDKICILGTFGFNRCRCRNYESPVKSFRPKKVLIVFRQYLSHLTCSRVHSCCVEIRIARHVTSCCVTSRRVMSRHVALCRIMSRHFTSCHVMSRHVTSCHVMPRDVPHVTSWHVMSRHVISRNVTSCHVMPRDVPHVTSWHVMSRHVISRNVTSCHVTSCHVMSHLAPSCHVMSYHVTSYHVKSRGTVTRPTLHYQLTSSTRNQFKLSMTVFVGCPEGCRYNTASAVMESNCWYFYRATLFELPRKSR